MENPINKWHEVVANQDHDLLKSILAENVIFYSPVVFTAQKGKDLTFLYLMAAAQVFNNKSFSYIKEIINENHATLEFELNINGIEINGIDLITWNEEGMIIEFKVFIRPLQGVNVIHKMMQQMLESFSKK
ncbi:hypothetical protein N9R78_00780 [Pelagibacteraceae bacterium]|jgi:hypothetical protein|nr:hypothetical protein [Pelagibacteraceae bacterium]|tara:strand:- start:89 stop:481 length:393 start_codon:yes stop_codon:yes gene_type:complete